MKEPTAGAGLREVVHQRVRLGVLAVLTRRGRATFTELRDALGQSDGALSRHLGVLEQHQLIATEKVFENRRPRTWVSMTQAGTEAFDEERTLLAQLLASASSETSDGGTDGAASDQGLAMAVVFAALLDGDGQGAEETDQRPLGEGGHSRLVPTVSTLAGQPTQQLASGPITARYDFPESHADFGSEQREQRLMLISHGLRGGWVSTWAVGSDADAGDSPTAQSMVLELGDRSDCQAILQVMGASTVAVTDAPSTRTYLLPSADAAVTAVAWLFVGPYLACVVMIAADDVAAASGLGELIDQTRATLEEYSCL